MTLGERIEQALEMADMTVKDLEAALDKAGVEGGSYANLHRLKSDKMERPSAGLLFGIADATDVNVRWLVADAGPRTEEEAAAERDVATRAEATEADPEWERDIRFKWDVLAALGVSPPDLVTPDFREDDEGRVVPEDAVRLMTAWANSVNAGQVNAWVPPLMEVRRRINADGEALGRALRGPLEALDLDANAMTRDQLGDYITAMVPVLLTLESHHEEED